MRIKHWRVERRATYKAVGDNYVGRPFKWRLSNALPSIAWFGTVANVSWQKLLDSNFMWLTSKECTSSVSRSILSLTRMYPAGVTVNFPPARSRLYENTALLPWNPIYNIVNIYLLLLPFQPKEFGVRFPFSAFWLFCFVSLGEGELLGFYQPLFGKGARPSPELF